MSAGQQQLIVTCDQLRPQHHDSLKPYSQELDKPSSPSLLTPILELFLQGQTMSRSTVDPRGREGVSQHSSISRLWRDAGTGRMLRTPGHPGEQEVRETTGRQALGSQVSEEKGKGQAGAETQAYSAAGGPEQSWGYP